MFGNLGSIIGSIVGFLIGINFGPVVGLLGAFFGGNIGMIISRGTIHAYRRPGGSYNDSHQSKAFFESLFSMIAAVSIADGTIDEEEKNTIRSFMQNQLRMSVEAQTIAMDIFNQAVNQRIPIQHSATRFYKMFRYDRQLLTMAIDILLRVSYANKEYHPKEEEALLEVVRIFCMPIDIYEQIKSRYKQGDFGGAGSQYSGYSAGADRRPAGSSRKLAYKTLGCSEGATDQEIKKAYRKMVQEYHPDKVASKGLPQEFAEFAGEKFKEVQSAYDMIKRERGIS